MEGISDHPAVSAVRADWRRAGAMLGKRDCLLTAMESLFFCIVTTFACYMTFMLAVTLSAAIDRLYVITEILALLFAALCFFFFVMPLWLGRWRLLGRMCTLDEGGSVPTREMFYYFTASARYRRALRLGLLCLAVFGIPVFVFIFLWNRIVWLYIDILLPNFNMAMAVFYTVLIWCLWWGLLVICLWLFGCLLLSIPLAIGNENIGMIAAFSMAWRAGRGRGGATLAALWGSLWRTLVSLATVGVAYLFYFGHQIVGAWFAFAMDAVTEGEQIHE